MTNMDKLYASVAANGPVCVGLDTEFSYLPADVVDCTKTAGENVVEFNRRIIEATKASAGCYKVQIAYYESLGLDGMRAYAETLKMVRATGLRSLPISSAAILPKPPRCTPRHTLPATLRLISSRWPPIWAWIPSAPTCRTARNRARACLYCAAPPTPAQRILSIKSWRTAAMCTTWWATGLSELGRDYIGESGYSSIGLVIGGTHTEEATAIRAAYPQTFS